MEQYKIPVIYGLYGAILGFVFYLMLLFSGNSPWSPASWMGCWIPGITVLFSIKKYHAIHEAISSSFSETLKIAVIAIFSQALFFNILAFLFGVLFESNVIEMYKIEVMQYAEQIKAMVGDERYVKMQQEIETTTLLSLTFGDFVNKIIGGIIVSLILAGILKKNKPFLKTNE